MPAALTYPGVYIEEIPSGVHTIVGVATSITAFLGRAIRGPVDQAVTINSFADFQTIFGGLWIDSNLGYAVRDFFLNGGSEAIIVRLFTNAADPGPIAARLKKAAKDAATPPPPPPPPAPPAPPPPAPPAPTAAAVSAAVTAAATKEKAAIPNTWSAELKKALSDMIDAIAKLASDAAAVANAKADDVAKAVSDGLQAEVDKAAGPAEASTYVKIQCDTIALSVASPGVWGKNLEVSIDYDVRDEVATRLGVASSELFNIGIKLKDAIDPKRIIQSEYFRNVTLKPSSRQLDEVLEDESDLVRYLPGNGATPARPATDTYPNANANGKVLNGGSDGGALDTAAFHLDDGQASKKGLYALDDADLVNLICIPPYNDNEEIDYASVAPKVAKYCADRRAMFIIDPPSSWTTKNKAVAGFRNNELNVSGTDARNAAVFFPRVRQANPLKDGRIEAFAPCGTVAGIFARTDVQRGIWKAPAGIDAALVGTAKLELLMTDLENGDLNPLGVNCLRTFPLIGHVVWGARTCRGADNLADEYKYIPIRRLALFIEESLFRGTKWVVFEPNDEPLWAQIRLNIGAFMHNLFRQGAFQGASAREAYFVKCDKQTTTQNDRDLGIVNIVVGFAPLKPAEFVVLQIQQIAGDIQT